MIWNTIFLVYSTADWDSRDVTGAAQPLATCDFRWRFAWFSVRVVHNRKAQLQQSIRGPAGHVLQSQVRLLQPEHARDVGNFRELYIADNSNSNCSCDCDCNSNGNGNLLTCSNTSSSSKQNYTWSTSKCPDSLSGDQTNWPTVVAASLICASSKMSFSQIFLLADIGVWTLCPLPLHHRPGLDVATGRSALSRQKYSGGNLCRCCCSCTLHIAATRQPPDNVICCCRSCCCCWCCSCCCVCVVAALVIASVSADPKQVSDTQDCKNCFNWKV